MRKGIDEEGRLTRLLIRVLIVEIGALRFGISVRWCVSLVAFVTLSRGPKQRKVNVS